MKDFYMPIVFALLGSALYLLLVVHPPKDQTTVTAVGDGAKILLTAAVALAAPGLKEKKD